MGAELAAIIGQAENAQKQNVGLQDLSSPVRFQSVLFSEPRKPEGDAGKDLEVAGVLGNMGS